MAKIPIDSRIMMLLGLIILLTIMMLPKCEAATSPTPLVYIDPHTIVGTTIGQEIEVFMWAKDFANLYMWQLGLTWNPAILTLKTPLDHPTYALPDSVFNVLAPGVSTMWNQNPPDQTKGTLPYCAMNLQGVQYGVNATADVAYKLWRVKFTVKAVGTSDIHLSDVMLGTPIGGSIKGMRVNILDYFTAKDSYTHEVKILTNSTGIYKTNIFGHQFIPADKALRFNLTSVGTRDWAPTGSKGFCNVTLPKDLMWVDAPSDWLVTVNGASPISLTPAEDVTNYYIYFTYTHTGTLPAPTVLRIEIKSKYVVPEFPAMLLSIFLAVTLIGVLSIKLLTLKRRNIVAK